MRSAHVVSSIGVVFMIRSGEVRLVAVSSIEVAQVRSEVQSVVGPFI